jgi:hypothetical protein
LASIKIIKTGFGIWDLETKKAAISGFSCGALIVGISKLIFKRSNTLPYKEPDMKSKADNK